MRHILHHWAQAAPLSLETTGDPRSANSAAPKGCMGQGMGSMPMSAIAQPVPTENTLAASTAAQGIVTRMGQDRNGLGGAAIEPGPEGMRPACWGACGVCDCGGKAAPVSVAAYAVDATGAACRDTPPE